MSPTVSLSTCWNAARHTDGEAMLREAAELGFGWVELSHGTRITLVPGILKGVESGLVRVSSVHNFCPLPMGVSQPAPNLYEPTSPDDQERSLWVRYTRQTIEFAHRVGATRCVLHGGSARFFFNDPAETVARLAGQRTAAELAADPLFRRKVEAGLKRVAQKAATALPRLRHSLEAVLEFAMEKGVRLAVENREGFDELPGDQGFVAFLQEAGEPGWLGCWHDTGHSKLKERMGVKPQAELLLETAKHLVGFHLHDVSPNGWDHQPLGIGEVDFQHVRTFFQAEHALVLELSPKVPTAEVERSRLYLEALLAGTPPPPPPTSAPPVRDDKAETD